MTKRKQRKNKKRKIILALLMLLLTGTILGTGTYAWFSANKTVTVSSIDVNVASSNGLQISADGINFKTILGVDEILAVTGAKSAEGYSKTYSTGVNQIPNGESAKMSPVSTIGEFDDKGESETLSTRRLKMFSGAIEDDGAGNNILAASQSTETNTTTSGDFIAFDMFLEVNTASEIYLTDAANAINGTTNTGIQNAARIALVYQGNTAAGTASDTVQGLNYSNSTYSVTTGLASPATSTENTVKIWEPNSTSHTATGISNAKLVYGKSDTDLASTLSYLGVKANVPASDKVALDSTNASYFQEVTPYLTTTETDTDYHKVFWLAPGITKFRVYMWVEGQDVDCENNASGGNIQFNLQFSLNSSKSGS